jgi:hypothetical protein
MARDGAKVLLGEIVEGADPGAEKTAQRKALIVGELCDRYFDDASAGKIRTRSKTPKKATTLAIDRGRIDRHIRPMLGKMSVSSVTRHDVEKFLHDVAEGKTAGRTKTKVRGLARVTGGEAAANRAVGLLGAIFSYAVRKDLRADNPFVGSRSSRIGRKSAVYSMRSTTVWERSFANRRWRFGYMLSPPFVSWL